MFLCVFVQAPELMKLSAAKRARTALPFKGYGLAADVYSAGMVLGQLLFEHQEDDVADLNNPQAKGPAFRELCKAALKTRDGYAAHDLCLRMLEEDPSRRISVSDALAHRYFSEREKLPRSQKREVREETSKRLAREHADERARANEAAERRAREEEKDEERRRAPSAAALAAPSFAASAFASALPGGAVRDNRDARERDRERERERDRSRERARNDSDNDSDPFRQDVRRAAPPQAAGSTVSSVLGAFGAAVPSSSAAGGGRPTFGRPASAARGPSASRAAEMTPYERAQAEEAQRKRAKAAEMTPYERAQEEEAARKRNKAAEMTPYERVQAEEADRKRDKEREEQRQRDRDRERDRDRPSNGAAASRPFAFSPPKPVVASPAAKAAMTSAAAAFSGLF